MLREYFAQGTEGTRTGNAVGMEVETDFVDQHGRPIDTQTTAKLLTADNRRPLEASQKLELGRQKIEVSIQPQPTAELAVEAMQEALHWLYGQAEQLEARPLFAPAIEWDGQLLWVQEERDAIWVDLDGQEALEQLCRCSSVQFTFDVHPEDAIAVINNLNAARLHEVDYAPNHQCWLNYISQSKANYRTDRYGGPSSFADLDDYVAQLVKHQVVMHQGQPVRVPVDQLLDPDIDLFLRSVWWHYRLRRYGQTLTVEVRPLARRDDASFGDLWKQVAEAAGL